MSDQKPSSPRLSYKDAGVDIDAGDALVERIKGVAKKTARREVLGASAASAHSARFRRVIASPCWSPAPMASAPSSNWHWS